MASRVTSDGVPDTSPINRLISRTRRLLRSTWVLTGLGATVALALGTLVVVSLTDLAVSLWPSLRFVALLIVVVPATWAFVTGVLRPLFRRLTATHVARRIESHLPGIHNRLVSCVDQSLRRGRVTVVGDHARRRVGAESGHRLVDVGGVASRQHHPGTVVHQRLRGGPAEAAGRPGEEVHVVTQAQVHVRHPARPPTVEARG